MSKTRLLPKPEASRPAPAAEPPKREPPVLTDPDEYARAKTLVDYVPPPAEPDVAFDLVDEDEPVAPKRR